jgi:uncharacterized protein YggE
MGFVAIVSREALVKTSGIQIHKEIFMSYLTSCRLIRCLTLTICFVCLPLAVYAQTDSFVPALTVAGVGEAAKTPDLAEIEAGVTTQAATAAEALTTNNATMQALLSHLETLQLDKKDIQTTAFNLFPAYASTQNNNSSPTITGYNIENRVHIKIRDLTRLGEILDSLVGKGANVVHSIQFGFADPQALQDQARTAAIADAKRKATLYAEAAGVGLGKVIAIQEESSGMPSPRMPMAKMMAAESAVPIAAGESALSVRVTVSFALE